MEVLYHSEIADPPTKYVVKYKKPKEVKVKKNDGTYTTKIVTEQPYYLTANIFYDGTHWATKNKVVNFAKDWIMWFLTEIPKIEKCKIEITYVHNTDTFDLDNKVYFWAKIILDLLKTPTPKQVLLAERYNSPIKTINAIKDDTVRYIDDIHMKYRQGPPAIEIKIVGRRANEQQTLF